MATLAKGPTSSNVYLRALQDNDGWHWVNDDGSGGIVEIFYYFEGSNWTDELKNVYRSATDAWETVAPIKFTEVYTKGESDFVEHIVDVDNPFVEEPYGARESADNQEFLGIGYNNARLSGAYYIGSWSFLNPDSEDYVQQLLFYTMLHEIGHGLGLEHPHSGVKFPGVNDAGDLGDNLLNQAIYSVMSSNGIGEYPTGPSAFDIAAIQDLYGVNTYNIFDTVYVMDESNQHTTIWDTGGIDSIVYNGSLSATIDLRTATLENEIGGGGFLSSVPFGSYTIANGVTIENARGGTNSDTIVGNAADNYLHGGDWVGGDNLDGGGGNDFLEGGEGHDWLDGGTGFDTAVFSGFSFPYFEIRFNSDGSIAVYDINPTDGDLGGDTLSNIERISNRASNSAAFWEVQLGTSGDDSLTASGTYANGAILSGGDGIDTITGSYTADWLGGSDGGDFLYGEGGNDIIDGGDGDDVIYGGAGNDRISGGLGGHGLAGGNDTIHGGDGNDDISGYGDDDFIYGENGHDRLYGGEGYDTIYGGSGNDFIDGGGDGDTIYGGAGTDTAYFDAPFFLYSIISFEIVDSQTHVRLFGPDAFGEELYDVELFAFTDQTLSFENLTDGDFRVNLGDDTYWLGHVDGEPDGNKTIWDGGGVDQIAYSGTYNSTINLNAGLLSYVNGAPAGSLDALNGIIIANGTVIENASGGSGNDTITGNAAANIIVGGVGDDSLLGEGGSDTFNGGPGNDIIYGDDRNNTRDFEPDTAIYSGNRSDYDAFRVPYPYGIEFDPWTVVLKGPDGFDILYGVEVFRFDDGLVPFTEFDTKNVLVSQDYSGNGVYAPAPLSGDPFLSTLGFFLSVSNDLMGASAIGPGTTGQVTNTLVGNGAVPIGTWASAPDRLIGGDNYQANGTVLNTMYGDAVDVYGIGGFDRPTATGEWGLYGGHNFGGGLVRNVMYGDGTLHYPALGGDDRLVGGDLDAGTQLNGRVENILYGDGDAVSTAQGSPRAGSGDVLIGGDNVSGVLDPSQPGVDPFAATVVNKLFSDGPVSASFRGGGSDTLRAGHNENAAGGGVKNTLYGGIGFDSLYVGHNYAPGAPNAQVLSDFYGGEGNDTVTHENVYLAGIGIDTSRNFIDGGEDLNDPGNTDADTFHVKTTSNGAVAPAGQYYVETVAAWSARTGGDPSTLGYKNIEQAPLVGLGETEIVVSYALPGGPSQIVGETAKVETIVLDNQTATSAGTSYYTIVGDFSGTELALNTVEIIGSAGDDVIDVSGLVSGHTVEITSKGGNDVVVGANDNITVYLPEITQNYQFVDNGDGTGTLVGSSNSLTTDGDIFVIGSNNKGAEVRLNPPPGEGHIVLLNIGPNAEPDAVTTEEDTVLSGNVLDDNDFGADFDPDNDPLTVQAGTYATAFGGTVVIEESGDFTYTPAVDFFGEDAFEYTLFDEPGDSDVAKVIIDVTPVNDAPVARDDIFSTDEDIVLSGNLLSDNGNGADFDVDGDQLWVQSDTIWTEKGGSVEISFNGDFTYTPAANFNGTDSFTYVVRDGYEGEGNDEGDEGTDTGTVTIEVASVFDPELAPVITLRSSVLYHPVDAVFDDEALPLDGVTSVATTVVGETTYAVVASDIPGTARDSLTAFSMGDDGSLTLADSVVNDRLNGASVVTTANVAGVTYVFVTASIDNSVNVFAVDAAGGLSLVSAVNDGAAPVGEDWSLDGADAAATAAINGTTYLFVAGQADNGVSVFSVAGDGSLTNVANFNDNSNPADQARSLTTAQVDGTTYLFASGSLTNSVNVFAVGADGSLNLVNTANEANGNLYLDGVRGLTTANVEGASYLFAASGVDSSVSVFAVAANGELTEVDGITDQEVPALTGANSVETAAVNGTTYLLVSGEAGNEASLFYVAANGKLTHLDSIPDTDEVALAGVEDWASVVVGGATYVLAASSADDGVSVFRLGTGFTEGGEPVLIDPEAMVSDPVLDSANGGDGDYDGAVLTVVRSGGANPNDVFSFAAMADVSVSGASLVANNEIIATFVNAGGELQIYFTNAEGTEPTREFVSQILSAVQYANAADDPPEAVEIDVTFKGGAETTTETVSIAITPLNDAPTLAPGAGEATEDASVDVDLAVLGDDVDGDDDGTTLSYAIITQPSQGLASINGTILTFDPGTDFQDLALNETRDVVIQVQATDSHGEVSNVADVTVTVTGMNDAPMVAAGVAWAREDGAIVNVDLATLGDDIDSDDDGASLNYAVVTQPSEGSASINSTTLAFDPGADFQDLALNETRDVVVEIQATDSHGETSNVAGVAVSVRGVNDAPTVAAGTGIATEDGLAVDVDLAVLGDDIDSDDDGASLSYAIITQPSEGSGSINGTTLIFDPGTDFQDLPEGETRDVMIQVQGTDGHGEASNVADVTMTVTGVNDEAVIGGVTSGEVSEDTILVTGGVLTISDIDAGEALFAADSYYGNFGRVDLSETGEWIYTVNNAAAQFLNTGDAWVDLVDVMSVDGTVQTIDITINGADEPNGNNNGQVYIGGPGDDVVIFGVGADVVSAGGGNDVISTGQKDDVVQGGDGDDTVNGGSGSDTLYGDAGNDTLNGDDGDDILFGGSGDDDINGGTGQDSIFGEAGNDTLLGGDGADTISGGAGDDEVNGGAGQDTLLGDAGQDHLFGGDDNDVLDGGDGDDVIDPGNGKDIMTGGLGGDVFVFDIDSQRDEVTDFENGVDQIQLAEGLTFDDLTVENKFGGALIRVDGSAEMLLQGIEAEQITVDDFVTRDDFML